MTPDELRALDEKVGQAVTAATRPLLPWLAAVWVVGGTLVISSRMDGPWWQPYAATAVAAVLVCMVLADRWRQRVSDRRGGK